MTEGPGLQAPGAATQDPFDAAQRVSNEEQQGVNEPVPQEQSAPSAGSTVRLKVKLPLTHLHVDDHTITNEPGDFPTEIANRAREAATRAGFSGHLDEVPEET